MARKSRLTPEVQAGFLALLRGGATVEAAAASVGAAISSLYWRRKSDPLFDLAWSSAAELSSGWVWDEAAGRKVRPAGVKRRLRFAGRRRAAFLRVLESHCCTDAAARATGVNRSTVRRHLARDPDFGREAREVLERGLEGLLEELGRKRAAREARIRSGELALRIEPKGEMTRDFDRQMLLLKRYERPDGTIGSRRVRHGRMRHVSFEEAILLLDRKMRGWGLVPNEPLAVREAKARVKRSETLPAP